MIKKNSQKNVIRTALVFAALIVSSTASKQALAGPWKNHLSIHPEHLDFGNVIVLQSSTEALTVKNHSNFDAEVHSASVTMPFHFSGGQFPGSGGTCGNVIHAHSECTIVLSFTPTASGQATGQFCIDFNKWKGGNIECADLTGTGVVVTR